MLRLMVGAFGELFLGEILRLPARAELGSELVAD